MSRLIQFLKRTPAQNYINAIIVSIGLLADIISLGLFFGAIHTPETGSNFYVNSQEFLAWVLIALIYSIGLINAFIRRRWRKLFGIKTADHSVKNMLWISDLLLTLAGAKDEHSEVRARNFKRDFSIMYVIMFPITFLYARAISATVSATTITSSPWGDVVSAAFITIPTAIGMMVITSMFDFALSMFAGDQNPEG